MEDLGEARFLRVEPLMNLNIDPARTALVLLDYQNYSVHPDGYWAQAVPGSAERAAPAVARTADVLLLANKAVARHTESGDLVFPTRAGTKRDRHNVRHRGCWPAPSSGPTGS